MILRFMIIFFMCSENKQESEWKIKHLSRDLDEIIQSDLQCCRNVGF